MNTYLDTAAHNALNIPVLAGIRDPQPLPPESDLVGLVVTDPSLIYRLQWTLRGAVGWDSPRGIALWPVFKAIDLTITRALNVAEIEHPFRGFRADHPQHIAGLAHNKRVASEVAQRAADATIAAFLASRQAE